MTRRLILIRHAKSGWDDFQAADHDRVLTERGQTAALTIGQWLRQHGYLPDIILTSDAMRTRQTTALVIKGLGIAPSVHEVASLYHAAPQTLMDVARAVQNRTVAVVGHNPGIGMTAEMLVDAPPAHERFFDYPTGATTVIDFADDRWCRPQAGKLVAFTVPRDL